MAIRDHTVRIRSSVPSDDTLTPPPRDASSTAVAWPETLRRCTRGDIALGVLALTRLHLDSEQCRRAQARGLPGRALPWPLPAASWPAWARPSTAYSGTPSCSVTSIE